MRRFKILPIAAFALLAILSLVSAAPAKAEGKKFLLALSDIRTARALLLYDTRPEFAQTRKSTVYQLDCAIAQLNKISIIEGNDPWHEPPPQSSPDPYWAVHSAGKLLMEARHAIAREPRTPDILPWYDNSLQFTDKAIEELAPWIESGAAR